jgi:hypothetical protein
MWECVAVESEGCLGKGRWKILHSSEVMYCRESTFYGAAFV